MGNCAGAVQQCPLPWPRAARPPWQTRVGVVCRVGALIGCSMVPPPVASARGSPPQGTSAGPPLAPCLCPCPRGPVRPLGWGVAALTSAGSDTATVI